MKSTFLALAIATAALNIFAPAVGYAQDYIVNGHNASKAEAQFLASYSAPAGQWQVDGYGISRVADEHPAPPVAKTIGPKPWPPAPTVPNVRSSQMSAARLAPVRPAPACPASRRVTCLRSTSCGGCNALARCPVVLFHSEAPDCPRFAGRERVVTRRGNFSAPAGIAATFQDMPGAHVDDARLDVEVTP